MYEDKNEKGFEEGDYSFEEQTEEIKKEVADLLDSQLENMRKAREKRVKRAKFDNFMSCAKICICATFFVIILLAITSTIGALLFKFGWNYAVVSIFDVNKISLWSSFIIILTVESIKSKYSWEKEIVENKKANIIIHISVFLFSIFILNPLLFRYTWNNIIPELTTLNLKTLTYWETFWFLSVISIFASRSSNNDSKKKKNK